MSYSLETTIEKLRQHQERLGIEFNPPATEAELTRLEQALERELPADIRAFYQFCDGFETDDALFRLVPIADSLEWSKHLSEQRFQVAEYMINSDVWEVVLDAAATGAYRVVNSNHGTDAEVALTDSLLHFVCRYLEGEDGVYNLWEWYEAEKAKLPSG